MNVVRTGRVIVILVAAVLLFGTTGCANKYADALDPFAEDLEGLENAGDRDNKALLGHGAQNEENARHALEVLGSYRRAQTPQPAYPVIQPAEVRLMWVPDHLNKAGDLVPAHYYYLRVLDNRWAVQDTFELEEQLDATTSSGSAKPWVYRK